MIWKLSAFKKLIKDSYKTAGLIAGRDEEMFFLVGNS